jgi:hypothetical protein
MIMRAHFFIILLAGIGPACSQHSGTKGSENASENNITHQAIDLAENYVSSQLKEAQKIASGNGINTWSDKQKGFVIDPRLIFLGPVDEDTIQDVIVSVVAFEGQIQVVTRHLILLSTNGKLALSQVVESDMEILFIKNGVITADVPTHARTSPLFNCSECRDVVNYRLQGGELVEVE